MSEMSIGEFSRRTQLSAKALRLYDELGLLTPAFVDGASGYRYYVTDQLERARLIALLRQLDVSLEEIRELLTLTNDQLARRVKTFWHDAEIEHGTRRELASLLIDRLTGKRSVMFEVSTRDMPARRVLCLKRNVEHEAAAWTLGKEFLALFKERSLEKMAYPAGATFCVYWGEVGNDSNGPLEWCRPVPDDQAEAIAERYPELTLRSEPAHREAYVSIAAVPSSPSEWGLAVESLHRWAAVQDFSLDDLVIKPEDLGMRITYQWSENRAPLSGPDCDFAIPFG